LSGDIIMARSKIALKDFLSRHCLIQPSSLKAEEEEYYVLNTEGSRYFMAQSHFREILNTTSQTDEVTAAAKKSGDFAGIILLYWKEPPEKGLDKIKIPVRLVENLSEQQAFLILRNLEGVQKDVEDAKILKDRLEGLFQDTAAISIGTGENGDRVFVILGKLSPSDQRHYMERYAEQVASKTLFDVAKALNSQLEQYVPEELREKFFVEGRDFSDKKIRYGEEVSTELMLSDEGAWVYTNIAAKNPNLREVITKLFRQAMTDPFRLSLTHYMGKHNVMKAGKRPIAKVPPLSAFFIWFRSLFGGKKEE